MAIPAAVVAAAIALIAVTWGTTLIAARSQRAEAEARLAASVASQAGAFADKLQRQLLDMDQTLRILAHAWESEPRSFSLLTWRSQLVLMRELSADILITDEKGIVRHDTVPEAIGRDVSDADFFRDATERLFDDGRMFIGPARLGTAIRLWHLNLAHRLHHPSGAFAGVIVAALRSSSLADFRSVADIGTHGVIAVVGLNDGRVRVAEGPNPIDPGTLIDTSDMFQAMLANRSGIWLGRSALDGVERLHGFERVPDRDLVVLVAVDHAEAMHPTYLWQRQAYVAAATITVLVLATMALLLYGLHKARQHAQALMLERAMLAGAGAQLEVARARADTKAAQLEATLAGTLDGVAIIDTDLRLVGWNPRFSELAGVPAAILHTGMPMADILRAQAAGGQFGEVDIEAEVARRVAALRSSYAATIERPRPDGTIVELRRIQLPDGGLVAMYSDISVRTSSEYPPPEQPYPIATANQPIELTQPLPRTRILLVADTPAKQMDTAALLQREGHLVDAAADGEAAVRAVASQPYDLILVGSGNVDAARAIRALDGPAASTPIVGLIDSLDAAAERQCTEAGMNGVLRHPADLRDALATHVWRRHSDAGPAPPEDTATTPILSQARLAELRGMLAPDVLASAIEASLVELATRHAALLAALQQGDADETLAQANAMAGIAGEYGMAALHDRLRRLMPLVREDLATSVRLAGDVAGDVERAGGALRDTLQIEMV